MRWVILMALLAAVAGVGWLAWRQNRSEPLVVSGFVEADQIRVGSRVGGRVAEVMVSEGQAVARGTPLFRVEPFDLEQRLARAEAERAAAEAEHAKLAKGYREEDIAQAQARRDRLEQSLRKLQAGPLPRQIEAARLKWEVAKANYELAAPEYKRVLELKARGAASPIEMDQAERELRASTAERARAEEEYLLLKEGTRAEEIAEAKAALAEADAALALLKAGYRPEEIASARAKLGAAAAEVEIIRRQLAELQVKAPVDCIVESIDLRPGDLVGANAPAVSLLERSRLWVRTYVPEGRMSRVKLGAKVPVRIDSFPGRTFESTITFVSSDAEFTPRNIQTPEERSKQVFRVKLTLDPAQEQLRPGMMADVLLDEAR